MQFKMISLLMIAGGCMLCGCGKNNRHSAASPSDADSVPSAVKELVRTVSDNDSDAFASLVSYPLHRPYPLRDIDTPEEMKSYYKVMVDDSLRNIIAHADPARWSEYGWRGWSLDDGQYVWVDDHLYEVSYLSALEKAQLDTLSRMEIETLDPAMRAGYKPEFCLSDTAFETIYRIDRRTLPGDSVAVFRLAIYDKNADLSGPPAKMFIGARVEEGSALTPEYLFNEGSDEEIVIESAAADAPNPRLYDGDHPGRDLRRVYWRDMLRRRPPRHHHGDVDSLARRKGH